MIHQIKSKITDNTEEIHEAQITSYLNIYNYMLLRRDPETVKNIDFFTLDGIMMILFLKLFFQKSFERKAPDFSSYFVRLFSEISKNNNTIGFVGGSKEDIKAFIRTVKLNYPKLQILHAINGYYSNEQFVIDQLLNNQPNVIIVGMGTPMQERFLVRLKQRGFKGGLYSCGAFISQTASKGRDYFPSVINKLHLRWAYRIYEDPKLFKRYALYYPMAMVLLLKDYVQKK
ncbi:WecB/TagA/CpsF family glycosyltransferase [Flagellimonas sp. 2504JD1-5]